MFGFQLLGCTQNSFHNALALLSLVAKPTIYFVMRMLKKFDDINSKSKARE
jgi:hypothetical protein